MTADKSEQHPQGCRKLFVNSDGILSCIAPFADDITREKCINGVGECEFRDVPRSPHSTTPAPAGHCEHEGTICRFYLYREDEPEHPCQKVGCASDTRSRPTPAPTDEQCKPHCYDDCEQIRNAVKMATCKAASEAREQVLEDLWKFCLINGAQEHGDIIGLPKDPFFPLKLIKKIAEMRYESLRRSQP